MSLKNNIQGQDDTRLEDANSINSTLRISPSDSNDFPLQGKAIILFKDQPSPTQISLTLDEFLVDDDGYGNLIVPYEFMRVYESDSNKDWLDFKVTKVFRSGNEFNDETIIQGIVVRGNYDDVNIGAYVKWSFYVQKPEDDSAPINTHVGDITDDSITFSWLDPTIESKALMSQVQYRHWGDETWTISDVGGWIFDAKINLEGARWPTPSQTYLGKPCYWMEFSVPDLKNGRKAEGWVEMQNGNYGETFIIDNGAGYRRDPNVTLYFKKLSDHILKNFHYNRGVTELFLTIHSNAHNFEDGDRIGVIADNEERLNAEYIVSNALVNTFRITPINISDFPDDTIIRQTESMLMLLPIIEPKVPGEIKPILSTDKYYITNLNPNSNYEISVVSYFSMDLKDFSEYSLPVNFKTF